MSFLDPYSPNRRISLWWVARGLLLLAVAAAAWGLWALLGD